MPLPAAYTEDALAAFVVRELAGVADALGWVAESPRVAEAVLDAVAAYGASAIADAADVPKLRALARVAAWRAAVAATAGNYRFADGGSSFDRQQVHAQAQASLVEAERAAAERGCGPLAIATAALDRWEPYSYRPDPEWGA